MSGKAEGSDFIPSTHSALLGFERHEGRVPEGTKLKVPWETALDDMAALLAMMIEATGRGENFDEVDTLAHLVTDGKPPRKLVVEWETMSEEEVARAVLVREQSMGGDDV